MIDWYSGRLGYSGATLKPNRFCEITPDGEITEKGLRFLEVPGSFDDKIRILPASPSSAMLNATKKFGLECSPVCLYVTGNPTKYLQGHNVFGPPVASLAPVIQAMVRKFPEKMRPSDADSDLWPAVDRTRVDTNISIDLGSDKLVHEWLQTARTNTRSRHGRPESEEKHSRTLVSGDTVYWGKHSRRWTLKAYCKFCELRERHPGDLKLTQTLREFCEGHLRLELTLRTLELKPRGTLNESLVWEYFDKLEVGVMNAEAETANSLLSRPIQFTLSRWMGGEDVAHSLPRPTFYRHRRAILDKLGLDISNTYEKKTAERKVFDLAYLKAHEIKLIPGQLQGFLFKAKESPVWPTH